MREVTVVIYDDLDYCRDGTKTVAERTVTIGLDGVWRELDLSEVRYTELQKLLGPYLEAGHPPAEAPKRNDPLRGRRNTPEFAYRKALREFATANGFRYITETGKYYYSKKLKAAYDEYLAKAAAGPVMTERN